MLTNDRSLFRLILRFKTFNALNILDPARRAIVIRCLYNVHFLNGSSTRKSHARDEDMSIVDLRSSNLSDIQFSSIDFNMQEVFENVHFDYTYLQRASFKNFILQGCHFEGSLMEAIIFDTVTITASDSLDKIEPSFSGAYLFSAAMLDVTCQYCNFTHANISNSSFYMGVYRNCIFDFSVLNDATLVGSIFISCSTDEDNHNTCRSQDITTFEHTQMRRVRMEGTQMKHVNIKYAILDDINMTSVVIQNSRLIDVKMPRCRIQNTEVKNSIMLDILMINCTINQTVFNKVNMSGSNLRGVNLTGTKFNECNLINVNLAGCIANNVTFERSNLENVDLTGCIGLYDAQLAKAYSIRGATLPNGTRILF